jgi:glutamate synthase domain-containing protein 2/glutamate synthase domain-containing protein 1/glutamate synthase domain-containing protein 3
MSDGRLLCPPLYDPAFEHDACGTGFVADSRGRPAHAILARALEAVANLTHRGAVDADAKTGDGAGVLTQLPRKLFLRELAKQRITLADPADLAVGMCFLPGDDSAATEQCRAIIERAIAAQGLRLLAWRVVPIDTAVLGEKARTTCPRIEQVLVARPAGLAGDAYERALYLARKQIERETLDAGIADCYLPSFSHRTIVYKGLFVAPQLPAFYADLRDPDYETALAVFHQRYSTNTLPNWFMAQPFRLLAHNGEINTVQGNRNWMRARQADLTAPVWGDAVAGLRPIIMPGGSDSASLDNAMELINLSGRDLLHAIMMLIPEAWEALPDMDPARRAFYQYHACLTEPWDGPASLTCTDGVVVAQTLDRNGLRPARYTITDDGLVIAGSEVGIVALPEERIVEKGRLGPGQLIAVDTARGVILKNDQVKQAVAEARPYRRWVAEHLRPIAAACHADQADGHDNGRLPAEALSLLQQQQVFGYSNEEVRMILEPMATGGKDAVWSMGDDAPLAVLSRKPRILQGYFRQRFAQVTNPPIDPLREELVMSIDAYVGRRRSLLEETPEHAHLLHLPSPLLSADQFQAILTTGDPAFSVAHLRATFPTAGGPAGLAEAVEALCRQAEAAVSAGASILVLSDRAVDADHAPIPMLLAVSAVHHHLIRAGLRLRADLIAETGDAWDIHHFCLLVGYGASAVYPYLAWAGVGALAGTRGYEALTVAQAHQHFRKAIEDGIRKVMSKMGISALSAYRGAQIFEAIGLDVDLVERYFTDTPSRLSGATLEDLASEVLRRHAVAFLDTLGKRLTDLGLYRFRRDGEYHAFNPAAVTALQKAAQSGRYDDWQEYVNLVYNRQPAAIRDLLDIRPLGAAVPLDEVESVESIRRRFTSQAMSLGALSPEAHSTIAIAMNRIGGRSNTGEGGEDPDWWAVDENGDSANSATKQVASARFGVTPEYLARARELEIKMAQGSKPGEGGQIPAAKVSPLIARLRHTIPGIPLISPPPHHDIYSIEDLAQLIYDLKIANPRARVGVKLVSETGVGTIAAGVAKAYADYILISGHAGGTGASPLSSIKHAGCPWELGLAETQQVLVMNGLRDRVTLRTDGGLMTGRDVIVAALLGAEEYGFGTAAVVAIGCDMARQCHLNTCPTGIATQRADLRAKFRGRPEQIVNFLTLLAQEVRVWLASLGARSLDEIIGRADLLVQRPPADDHHSRRLDLSAIVAPADPTGTQPLRRVKERNDRPGDQPLDDQIIRDAAAALDGLGPVHLAYAIRNSQRTVGARLSGEIARRYGNKGLPAGTIRIDFHGSAGQSFGAFLTPGVHLTLTGEANDYVGKGLGGGTIVVRPRPEARFAPHENVIVGNTVLYGATGGELFVAGRAGERFGVRCSGARAVVEGCGDHGCEYMTEGMVVVLGPTGRNFAAGMSAGVAYVYDEAGDFARRCNQEMVSLERLASLEDEAELRGLIARHAELTGSAHAAAILDRWDDARARFWKVVPHPVVVETTKPEEAGLLKPAATEPIARRA